MTNTFYLLVAGSRGYEDYKEMCNVLDFLLKNQIAQEKHIIIVSGGARGANTLAERYADEHGYGKNIIPAQWDKYGRGAGYRRNEEMHLHIASPSGRNRGCVCFWDMKSKGTQHNFRLSELYKNPIRVFDTINHRFLTDEEVKRHA